MFRLLWRDQSAFNTLLLEAATGLADELSDVRSRLREAEKKIEDVQRVLDTTRSEVERREADLRAAEERIVRWSAGLERRRAIQDGRLAILESRGPAAPPGPPPSAAPQLPPGVYALFEERFRGSPEEIAGKQAFYLPLLDGIPGPVLDAGCGRGEFLQLLRERGIPASGVESNPIAAAVCHAEGLDVEQGDALASISRRPDARLGAVVALQVVEHWTSETTFAFLREARRALAPGGVLLLETINADSLSALRAFFLDPSHVRPVPAAALAFLAESAGFVDARVEYLAPLPEADRLAEVSENETKLNRLLFGPQDYALIARVPTA